MENASSGNVMRYTDDRFTDNERQTRDPQLYDDCGTAAMESRPRALHT